MEKISFLGQRDDCDKKWTVRLFVYLKFYPNITFVFPKTLPFLYTDTTQIPDIFIVLFDSLVEAEDFL